MHAASCTWHCPFVHGLVAPRSTDSGVQDGYHHCHLQWHSTNFVCYPCITRDRRAFKIARMYVTRTTLLPHVSILGIISDPCLSNAVIPYPVTASVTLNNWRCIAVRYASLLCHFMLLVLMLPHLMQHKWYFELLTALHGICTAMLRCWDAAHSYTTMTIAK